MWSNFLLRDLEHPLRRGEVADLPLAIFHHIPYFVSISSFLSHSLLSVIKTQ